MGGLFAPALFMGACLGGLSGRVLRDNFWPWAINLPFLGIEKASGQMLKVGSNHQWYFYFVFLRYIYIGTGFGV